MSVRSIVTIFAILFSVPRAFSQLQVTANNNATALATSLAGSGVIISGATINCSTGACGTFNGTASNIGIAGGVLLTTGSITQAVGPNNLPSAGQDYGINFSDPDLTAIEPTATFDPCVLEFTAIPSCSTLAFTFAFGSEEYNEYVKQQVNDCFGIFVTGPNPSGPAYSGYNMALIPSTSTAVSIDNVNNGYNVGCPATGPCTNCSYYIDNCNGATVQYDGFTQAITVTLNVVPCGSYHFKLAIADAGDGVFDSGVFFKVQSLLCNTSLTINTSSTPSACTSNNGTATVTSVSGGLAPYTYSWGTVPVQTTQTATGLGAGTYTVTVIASGCLSGTATVTVSNTGGFTAVGSQTNATCFGSSDASAAVLPSGGTAPYAYLWSTSPSQTTSSVSGISAGNYTCVVTDAGGCTYTQTFTITQPLSITTTLTSTPTCNNIGTTSVTASGGTGAFTYSWMPGGQTTASATGLTAGTTYSVTVTDANGCSATSSVLVAVLPPPIAAFNSSMPCLGVSTQLLDGSVATQGDPIVSWYWTMPGGTPSSFTGQNTSVVYPAAGPYNVTLVVISTGGCVDTIIQQVVIYNNPIASFTERDSGCAPVCVDFSDASQAVDGTITSWMWNFPGAAPPLSIYQNPANICYKTPGTFGASLIVTNTYGCMDTISLPGIIDVYPYPNADFCFSPNQASVTNPVFTFCDMWTPNPGVTGWVWDFGDGSPPDSTNANPIHSYSLTANDNAFHSYTVTLIVVNQYGCKDTISKVVEVVPEFTFYIPNTFSPNGDGFNAYFYAKGIGIKEYAIWIFDRWGNQLWDCQFKGNNTAWDASPMEGVPSACKWDGQVVRGGSDMSGHSGKYLQEDVYVWKVKLTDVFDQEHNYIGHLNVIR